MNDLVIVGGALTIGLTLFVLATAGYLRVRPRAAGETTAGPVLVHAPAVPPTVVRPQTPAPTPAEEPALPGPSQPRPADPALSGRRLWLRVGAVVAGLVLLVAAIQQQAQLWDQPNDLGAFWWLIALGVEFGVVVGTMLAIGSIAAPPALMERAVTGAAHRIGQQALTAFALAVGAEAACIALFWIGRGLTIAWILHLGACAFFLAGLWHMSGSDWRRFLKGWTRIDTIVLAVLLVAAFAVRIWHDDVIPEGMWFDEGQRGLEALHILADRNFRPVFAPDFIQEPIGLWYLIAALLPYFGREVMALRLPVVVFGTLGVGAIYVLALMLYGRRVAVIAGGLAVGFVWHLNFSRIALPAIPSLTFDTLTVLFFVVGLRRSSRTLLGLAGFTAAVGLYFYFISQLVPLVLAVVGLHHLLIGRGAFVRRNFVGFVLFALGFAIALGPVAQYALRDWRQFSARARTITVTNEIQQSGSWTPLINNVKAHLLMFNVKGDNNGRHNWTGHPMLDPVTGGLAMAGLALALTRARRPEWLLPLVWLPIATAGGVLSVSFEAPQSHRSFDAVVPVLLLAALPLGVLWAEADRLVPLLAARRPRLFTRSFTVGHVHLAIAGLVIVLLVGTNVMNVARYFSKQQTDGRTWSEMSSAQTAAGRQVAALPAGLKVYLEPQWVGFPSINFLVSQPHQFVPFDPAVNLPITDDSAAIYISDRKPIADQIASLYPMAQRTYTAMPDGRTVAGYGFVLSPSTLQANRGVAARYQSGGSTLDRREASLDLDWTGTPPVQAPFDATFTATLTVPTFGGYQLLLEGPPSLTLTLDGTEVLTGGKAVFMQLARGNHALRLSGTALGGEPIRLLWSGSNEPPRPIAARFLNVAPVETTGLYGRINPGEVPTAEAAVEQIDPNVDLRVHILPLPRPYTIEWSGALRVEQPGTYRFGVGGVGTSTIWVDGAQLGQNTAVNGYGDGEAVLERGWHDIRVRFVDKDNFSSVTAYWQPPGRSREPIPTSVLRPWPAFRVPSARPEDADLPTPKGPVSDESAPRLTPIAAPEKPAAAAALAEAGSAASGLGEPRGIAVGPDGSLYAADAGRKMVVKTGTDGSTTLLGEGSLKEPSAVAVLPDGGLVVLDAGAGEVHRLGADGKLGERLFADFPLYGPRGLAATLDGQVIVTDTGNNRVLIGAPGGQVEAISGLVQPTSAVMLRDGTFLVAETGASRIVQLGPGGKRIASWTMPPTTTVVGPHAAALPDGGWAVTAPEERAVIVKRGDDSPAEVRPLGSGVRRPTGLFVDGAGYLVVADAEGAALRRFSLP